jgi:hypothetical protein
MNNKSNVIDIVNKIPQTLYFNEIPDREQALQYLTYLYENVPGSKQIKPDLLFREVIARELRMVSMKIIEPEILLLVALNNITLDDFTISSSNLVRKVMIENNDKFELDIMQRVVAQVMTKLPRDIRERVTGKQKLQLFQLMAKQTNMDPKLLENFVDYDPTLNVDTSNAAIVTMELNKGDYNTLNKKYLQDLYNYQKSQPYISADNLEYGILAAEIEASQPTNTQSNEDIKAAYIDQQPDLMLGTDDNTLYYFDSSSGTLSEMPITGGNQTPISVQDLKTILISQKIQKGEIQNAIDGITGVTNTTIPMTTIPMTTIPSGFIANLENMFLGLFTEATQAQATLQATANLAPTEPVPPAFIAELYNLKKAGSEQNQYSVQKNDKYKYMMSGLNLSNVNNYGSSSKNLSSSTSASLPGMYSNNLSSNQLFNKQKMLEQDLRQQLQKQIQDIQQQQQEQQKVQQIEKQQQLIQKLQNQLQEKQLQQELQKEMNQNFEYDYNYDNDGYTQNDALPKFKVVNPKTTYKAFSGPDPNKPNTSPNIKYSNPDNRPTFPNGQPMSDYDIMIDRKFKMLYSTYQRNPTSTASSSKSGFRNLGSNSESVLNNLTSAEETVITKIKNDNKNVEKIAIGFITILILIFLIVIIIYIKSNNV